jgi:hypothetical protein
MLYGAEVAVSSEINTRHINTVWAESTIIDGFGGLEVTCWVQTRPKPPDFSGRKNPQHAFLRRGCKAVGLMS